MTLYSRHLYKTGHPKLAAGMNLMRGGIHFAAGAHNMSILPPAPH